MIVMSNDITKIVNMGNFYPVFQPIYYQSVDNLYGVEVLTRWKSDLKLDLDVVFKEIDDLNLGITFLEKLIAKVISELEIIPASIRFLSLNVSIINLIDVDFLHVIEPLLNKCREKYIFLAFEITEVFSFPNKIKDIYVLFDTVEACKNLGIKFSIDDFGKGFNNNEIIIDIIKPQIVKLDKSFCKNRNEDLINMDVLNDLLKWRDLYGFSLLAEGIETFSGLSFIKSLGIEYFQGYLFCKPEFIFNIK
ncbi:EAL domain-containing protein [Vibrio parahaemolyticus]|nr:EAL domain-containing protein [Vibrio parahaemolyticus]